MRARTYVFFFLILLFHTFGFGQIPDSTKLRQYRDIMHRFVARGLELCRAHDLLHELCTTAGPRLSGSPNAAKAIKWAKEKMEYLGLDSVWLEPVMVPHWVRGGVEEASILRRSPGNNIPLRICALGGSVGTPSAGITSEVAEVRSFEELRMLGERARGKIIFFNRPMDRGKFSTGEAYGGAVDQRSAGAVEAAKVGGVAALVRSMTTRLDDVPHTGMMSYVDTVARIPAAAISTVGANLLSDLLKKEPGARVRVKLSCQTFPDVESANVIGQITGSDLPGEVVVVGGHFDSWDKGQGAHDDGAGCMQAIEALLLMKDLGLRPKRTVRAVLFANEENGARGGRAYAEKIRPGERHVAAIESDAGGLTPRGFGINGDSMNVAAVSRWSPVFEAIDAASVRRGWGGVDVDFLRGQGVPTIGLRVDGQKYFDYHHSDNDVIGNVNERELELGAIAMAMLAYMLAQEGM